MLTLFTVCALLGGTLLTLALLERNAAWSQQVELHATGAQPPIPPNAPRPYPARSVLLGLVSFAAFFGLGGSLAAWLGLHPTFQLIFALLSGLAVGGFTAFALSLAQTRGELFQDALESQSLSLVERTAETLLPTGSRTEPTSSGQD